ncbi:MAG: 4-hydroxy-tetrahydrodipicolinate reductase [Desulfovibrionaceae bacterium]|nr:4-hydroxy-tetrahydrodipicolinate reductase [Desulfovibrionaceae bacterium]
MSVTLIVMGAAGRMGATLARLISEAPDLTLGAVLERAGHESQLAPWSTAGTIVETNPAMALAALPGAVVVDFTAPDATMNTARLAAEHGNPMVIGTTGLTDDDTSELRRLAQRIPLLLSPNMSVGINVLLEVLPELTRLLGDAYDVELTEIHHNHKKDAPSGTAVRLAEALADAKGWNLDKAGCYGRAGMTGERPHTEIGVHALRGGDVVGVHTVYYMGPGERIEITHHAHSRENFANGALRAARWLVTQKPGRLYSMHDVLSA